MKKITKLGTSISFFLADCLFRAYEDIKNVCAKFDLTGERDLVQLPKLILNMKTSQLYLYSPIQFLKP